MLTCKVRNCAKCVFMKQDGCSFPSGRCSGIVEQCIGCNNIIELDSGKYCNKYGRPDTQWMVGDCNCNTHIIHESAKNKKINPLKESKKKSRR